MKYIVNVTCVALVFLSFSCAKEEGLAPGIPAVAIEPKLVNASESSQVNFNAGGGLGFYKYKIMSGSGNVSTSTGVVTNMQVGQIVIRVSDLIGNYDDAVINVSRDFSLPYSTVYLTPNQQYTLQYHGGTPPVVYSRVSGDSMVEPNTGVIIAASAMSKTVIKVTDAEGNVQMAEVFVIPPLQFDEIDLVLTYGESHTFQVHGGIPPYSFDMIAGAGTLMQQLGVFIAPYFSGHPVVRVTDSVGLTRDIQIEVVP